MRSVKVAGFILTVLAVSFFVSNVSAQTTLGFRQNNLTSRLSAAPNQSNFLIDPWGIAFLPGGNFFIAENNTGRVDSYDANGVLRVGLSLPLPAGSTATHSRPTGIVADPDSNFSVGQTSFRFFAATEEGTIVAFNLDGNGQPINTRIVVDHSASGAVYTGITLLHPACCNARLAVANFHTGDIETYQLSQVTSPGTFEDPNLPAGYAPYNIRLIGDVVFVTYAKQDEAKKNPVTGLGNGVVSMFHQDGTFFARFASDGGRLDTPWGIALTPATFGPQPSRVLIGNTGSGRIGIYDSGTGGFLGLLDDSEGKLIANDGLWALTFRNDGVGDPDFLYLVAAPQDAGGENGLFADVQVGRLTQTQLFVTEALVGVETNLLARVNTVAGGDIPNGQVVFSDNNVVFATVDLNAGSANLTHTYTTAGIHNLIAEYQGTDNLLKSFDLQPVRVLGPATTTTLAIDVQNAAVGAPVTFTATTQAAGVIPTGSVLFREGAAVLGTVPVDGAGKAVLVLSNLSSGAHSVFASYLGNDLFQDSQSPASVVNIGGDFQFTPAAPSITVGRGRSTDVVLNLSPNNGFNGQVTFGCLAPAGITCSFNPATVAVNGVAAATRLTVSAAATAANHRSGSGLPFAFGALGTVLLGARARKARIAMTLALLALGIALVGCGGGSSQTAPPHVTTVTLNATSGSITHSTTIGVTVQ